MIHDHLETGDFKLKIEEGGFELIDMRTPEEFETGHIVGASNMDFTNPDFNSLLEAMDKDKRYLLYCRTGNKSGETLELMMEMEFAEAYNMVGGIVEWNDEGYNVVK